MREIVHIQAGQCGNQIGAKVSHFCFSPRSRWTAGFHSRNGHDNGFLISLWNSSKYLEAYCRIVDFIQGKVMHEVGMEIL